MLDHAKFKSITTFILDVDGVLTDGKVLITEQGEFLRMMSVKDGQAMKLAIGSGYNIFIITKGASLGVRKRLEILGVSHVYDKVTNKLAALEEIMSNHNITQDQILYMGDDLPDIICLKKAGIAACPADAVPEVQEVSQYIAQAKGGDGCVREVIERVMKVQGKWYDPNHL